MRTLFPKDFNWPIFIGLALLIRVSFGEMSYVSYFSVLLSLHHFILFFNSVGKILPVRYLLGLFMCIQFFIGPSLSYNGFDEYQYVVYRMRVTEGEYFSYAIPAVVSFIIGLHTFSENLLGENLNEDNIKKFVAKHSKLPYIFIILGFFTSVLSEYFSSQLAFVFYLLGSLKFIGLFMLVLGTDSIKPLPLVLVIGSIVSSSLGDGMFHDLLTWIIFVASVYAIKYRFGLNIKLLGLGIFIVMAIIIQQMKGVYRTTIGTKGGGDLETFTELYEQQSEKKDFFGFESLAPAVTRINQGFIITNIMVMVPDKEPYANGAELYQILEAAFLPRFIAPNKLQAGDRSIFLKYSGIRLRQGTSMGLSSLGDAYINFGLVGGCIFMFVLGFAYNWILKTFEKKSLKYPMLILFVPLVFYYPIRPDCELQTILGHVVKSCFLIYLMMTFWKDVFKARVASYKEMIRKPALTT